MNFSNNYGIISLNKFVTFCIKQIRKIIRDSSQLIFFFVILFLRKTIIYFFAIVYSLKMLDVFCQEIIDARTKTAQFRFGSASTYLGHGRFDGSPFFAFFKIFSDLFEFVT